MYRLLLADDSETTKRIVTLAFKEPGYQVIAVSSGEEALDYINRSPVDLVLADVALPGIDGYSLCGILGEKETGSPVPVILMGSIKNPVDARRIDGLDCAAALEKPFETSFLESLVNEILAGAGETEAPGATTRERVEVPESLADAVISAICSETVSGYELLEGLGVEELTSETRPLGRGYVGIEDFEKPAPAGSLSENEYAEVVEMVLERLSGTLRSAVPEAAAEVMKRNRG